VSDSGGLGFERGQLLLPDRQDLFCAIGTCRGFGALGVAWSVPELPNTLEIIAMKLTAILLALPLALGSGAVFAADSTTTTKSMSTDSGSPTTTESKTKVEHNGLFGDKTVEKDKSTSQNADGSVSMEKSKKVTKD
jgi:hypothetical protein